VTTYNILVQ